MRRRRILATAVLATADLATAGLAAEDVSLLPHTIAPMAS